MRRAQRDDHSGSQCIRIHVTGTRRKPADREEEKTSHRAPHFDPCLPNCHERFQSSTVNSTYRRVVFLGSHCWARRTGLYLKAKLTVHKALPYQLNRIRLASSAPDRAAYRDDH